MACTESSPVSVRREGEAHEGVTGGRHLEARVPSRQVGRTGRCVLSARGFLHSPSEGGTGGRYHAEEAGQWTVLKEKQGTKDLQGRKLHIV